jgi:hypothetical protein
MFAAGRARGCREWLLSLDSEAGLRDYWLRVDRCGAHMGDDEVTEFIIGRLAELVVVLFNEHVGNGPEAVKARSDTRLVLTELGNWAARNRRADLMPLLHGLAASINEFGHAQEAEPTFYEPIRTIAKVRFRW